MKNLNRFLLILAIGYAVLTLYILYSICFQASPFYGGKWKLVWQDEFNTPGLDLTKWTPIIQGSSSNDELQAFIDENVFIQNGCLVLASKKEDWTGPDNFHPGQALTMHYTSGKVETKRKAAWSFGRFEVKAKFPSGKGLLSYAALFPADDTWPPEIEIMEVKGKEPRKVNMLNHWGTYAQHHCDTSGPIYGPDYSASFHIFAIEWEPGCIRWYVDGVQKYQVKRNVPYQPQFLSLRTSIGGVYGGNPYDETVPGRPTVLPQYFVIDWIRVYQRR